ncbi:undecaprenyl-diphosphatase [Paenibacillus shirakamiensis]|uniref:Undecaprenyl-diphosphatase n=1 Tax=Paenibacillus shirakamiensis TaxID=1265935 RepID=A0ABS4JIG5_9BACL|nr:phosphatase PAP2 family protein [Paenibacillus shirakamiensis]MBP2000369.1 undecaprenyl-diphosphatase [Paenibacillus shirakamiensis]
MSHTSQQRMFTPKWITSSLLFTFIFAIAFGLTAVWISDRQIRGFDSTVITFVQGWESPWLTYIMKTFTWIGSGIPAALITIVAMFIFYRWLGSRRELWFLAWMAVGSLLLNLMMKSIFQRERPMLHRIVNANGFSFPSGHAMATLSLYGGLAFLLWKHAPTWMGKLMIILFAMVFIFMIGLSRIYLGVHYPSDVLGGYLLSGALLSASIGTYLYFRERSRRTGLS